MRFQAIVSALLAIGLTLSALQSAQAQEQEQEQEWRYATSLIGEPKYPADFAHFDYVNPDAPKGGELRLSETGGFDSLNPILPKGEAATGIASLVYETLMTRSEDEVSTEYGLLAEALSYPDDFSEVTYRLNPDAKWHDGEPVTAQDVVWSFEKLVELNPQQRFYYKHVTGAEALDEHTVRFTFDETGNKELPNIVGQIPVMPQHWWEGTDASGKKRDIGETTLEPPLGSGPYRVSEVNPGSTMTFERVDDYWGSDLPVNVGRNNFDRITYTYYRDLNVEFQAFKAGEFDYWLENEAKRWATAYDFPAAEEGKIKREEVENPYRTAGILVGFVPNLRRPLFQDYRVRRALNLVFDFETLNQTIFYNQYERIDSFFYGIPLRWEGLPTGKELDILKTVKDEVPPEVFTEEYTNPVNGGGRAHRQHLREALRLLQDAGFEQRDGMMVNTKTGRPFSFEVILNGPTIERVALPFAEDLRKIGIEMRVRSVEPSQYINRVRSRDFDMIYTGWAQSMSPGNEQFDYFGSEAADREASRNYGGIKDPAVDALIKRVVFAKDRDELVAATKALDRVLMANQYVIPTYTSRKARFAYWDKFGHPDDYPEYGIGFPDVWWYDAKKAAALK